MSEKPNSVEAEAAVIGCCLLDADVAVSIIADGLEAADFYDANHRMLFEVVKRMVADNTPVEETIFVDELRKLRVSDLPGRQGDPMAERTIFEAIGGYRLITDIADKVETTAYVEHWVSTVREHGHRRRLLATCQDVIKQVEGERGLPSELLASLEQRLTEASMSMVDERPRLLKEGLDAAIGRVVEAMQRDDGGTGLSTGFADLDALLMGFRRKDLYVLAARPSMGKTALGMTLARSVAEGTKEVPGDGALVFSMEMPHEALALRLLCAEARLDSRRLMGRMPPVGCGEKLARAAARLGELPIWVDDSSALSLSDVVARTKAHAKRHSLGLVMVDYLQLMKGENERIPRERQVAMISGGLKQLAKDLEVDVLCLSQLNRESEKAGRKPRLSDLKESGAIEQDADVVMFLYSDESEEHDGIPQANPVRVLDVAKNRNGPVGRVKLTFIAAHTRFENHAGEMSGNGKGML